MWPRCSGPFAYGQATATRMCRVCEAVLNAASFYHRGCYRKGFARRYSDPASSSQSLYASRRPTPYRSTICATASFVETPFARIPSILAEISSIEAVATSNAPPSITSVNSPRGSLKCASAPLIVPLQISSYTFVSSRATAIRRSPSVSSASASVARSRCGDSYATSVSPDAEADASARLRGPDCRGRNPR